MNTCYIVGAGSFTSRDFLPQPEDLVIAADGGYLPLQKLSISPQLLLGDFDSLGGVPSPLPDGIEVLRFPVEKDDTDTGLALSEGFRRGYRQFALYGCGGGRMDHLLANLQSMCRYCKQGASLRLCDPEYDAFVLHNGTLKLPPRPLDTLVSVFCNGNEAQGVTLTGLQYPLTNATLTCDFPLGVSNHYAEGQATVSVQKGTLWVMVALS